MRVSLLKKIRGEYKTCGAKTRRGSPCLCLPVPGKLRCKFHGGLSTGPITEGGKLRSLKNLRQYQ